MSTTSALKFQAEQQEKTQAMAFLSGLPWSQSDDDFIVANKHKHSTELAEALGRTYGAVIVRRTRLGAHMRESAN